MVPAAISFVSGLFTALQFHSFWISAAVLGAAVLASVFCKKPALTVLTAAGLVLGHVHQASMPVQPVIRDKGFVNAVFHVTGFPVLTPEGKYRVTCGNVTLISENLHSLYRSQSVYAAGPASSFSTNGRTFRTVIVREFRTVREGFRPFAAVSAVRKWTDERIRRETDPDIRSLLYTMILGNTQFLSYSVKESFRMTGVTHLLAISGLNVALIGMSVFFLLNVLFGKKPALALSCSVVALYVVTAGFGASVLRAGIMFCLYQFLRFPGKDPDILDVTAASLFPVLTFDPFLLFDMGFWLSYGALTGIILFGNQLRTLLAPAGRIVSETLGTTFAANITTLPLLMFFFGGFSLAAPLANLVILPVFNIITCLLFLLFLSFISGLTLPVPAVLLELPLKFLWQFSTGAADLLSLIPGAFLTLPPEAKILFPTVYTAAALGTLLKQRLSFRRRVQTLTEMRDKRRVK